MNESIKVKRADVAAIVAATYPDYKGRKFQVRASESVRLHDLNWSGGTRNQYRACTLAGSAAGFGAADNHTAPWNNKQEGARVPIPAGVVIVEHCMFCGSDLGLRIYVNPADMPALLQNRSAA